MWKIILQKYALLVFFAKYHKFAETEVIFFFFWKGILFPFQWVIALYGTVSNGRDMIF